MAGQPAPPRAKPLVSWPFGLALATWAVVAGGFIVGFTWLLGLAPTPSLTIPLASIYLIAPAAFWIWGASMAFRGSWRAALIRSAFVVFTVAAVMVAEPRLFDLGVKLHFLQQQAVFDEIVRKERAERTPPTGDPPLHWRGVAYRIEGTDPAIIDFPWSEDPWSTVGVIYDQVGCPTKRPPPTPTTAPPKTATDVPAALVNGGNVGYGPELGGHYCFLNLIG